MSELPDDLSRRTSRTTTGSPRSPLKNAYGLVRAPTSPDEAEPEHELIFADVVEALGGSVKLGADAVATAVILRLSWLGLSRIGDGLLGVGSSLKDLYLQHNRLTRIEGLESLVNLEFLALQGNRLRKIEGLSRLLKLKALDVSNNLIETLPIVNDDNELRELPVSIRIFSGASNPMAEKVGYKEEILNLLPECICLDREDILERIKVEEVINEKENGEGQENKETKSPSKKEQIYEIQPKQPSTEVTSEATQFALDEAFGRYQTRKENLSSLFATRIEAESARSVELARLVDERGKMDLDSARNSLKEFREGVVARSKERALEQKKRTQAVQEALARAAEEEEAKNE
jgi:Leucine-rich repeat (LRR) protein